MRAGFILSLVVVSAALAPVSTCCQLVADGATNILDGVATNITGGVTVGTNGAFTLLIVTNGASVSNTASAYIGSSISAKSNAVVVTGSGSGWTNGINFYVGISGAFNQLSILDGGRVVGGSANIGQASSSSNNLVLVSDPGSILTNSTILYVGDGGRANQLVVSNGGMVVSGIAYVGNVGFPSCFSNTATITGTNSLWKCSSLNIGNTGSVGYNQLVVANGGAFSGSGNFTIGSYSQTNIVTVADPGSRLTNSGNMIVGFLSKGNQLIVSNGAFVGTSYTYVEQNGGAQQKVIVTGTGSLLTNQNDFYLGQQGSSNSLLVADGGRLANNIGYVGYDTFSSFNNLALISGTNSLWTNRSELDVGYNGSRNRLILSNGAKVFNSVGNVGYNASASNNAVVVTEPGSLWTNRSALYIGRLGSFNQLFVTNGGTVISPSSFLANDSSSLSNSAVVAGSNSLWKTLLTLTVGDSLAAGNQLIVSNAGTVQANKLTVGNSSGPTRPTNLLAVLGGNVIVTDTLTMGNLTRLTLDSGLIKAGTLSLFGGIPSTFNFNGGTLQTTNSGWSINPFVVGNGSAAAIFEMLSSGFHTFGAGLVISSNALVKGVGSISANITVLPGATLSPGASIGQISVHGNLLFNDGSTNLMELNASTATCDTLIGMSNLTYGGTLQLTNLAGTLTNGSSFQLYSASNYSGAFSAILPPTPGPGLKWNTNALNVEGVLRVFSTNAPPPTISAAQISGTNLQLQAAGGIPYDPCYLLTATNLVPPVDWRPFTTNHFDALGNTLFTIPVSATEPERFFRLQVD